MHQKILLSLFGIVGHIFPASSQITGTYSVEVTATTPVGTVGTEVANYPQCVVSINRPLHPWRLQLTEVLATQQDCDAALHLCPPSENGGLLCACGIQNRGNNSACQALACSDADYLRTLLLCRDLCEKQLIGYIEALEYSHDICESTYEADPSLASAVSSAIASETAAALSAVASINGSNQAEYPECARKKYADEDASNVVVA
ncbi:MAG: hypothetical protein Q9169_007407 [Polycauliona sp. 2 TL-2023]